MTRYQFRQLLGEHDAQSFLMENKPAADTYRDILLNNIFLKMKKDSFILDSSEIKLIQ